MKGMGMRADELYQAIGYDSAGSDIVGIIDKNSGKTYQIVSTDREERDGGEATFWISVEEN